MSNRVVVAIGAIVSVLLAGTIVTGIVVVNTINSDRQWQTYLDCMARHGYAPDQASDDVDGMVAAAERCEHP